MDYALFCVQLCWSCYISESPQINQVTTPNCSQNGEFHSAGPFSRVSIPPKEEREVKERGVSNSRLLTSQLMVSGLAGKSGLAFAGTFNRTEASCQNEQERAIGEKPMPACLLFKLATNSNKNNILGLQCFSFSLFAIWIEWLQQLKTWIRIAVINHDARPGSDLTGFWV